MNHPLIRWNHTIDTLLYFLHETQSPRQIGTGTNHHAKLKRKMFPCHGDISAAPGPLLSLNFVQSSNLQVATGCYTRPQFLMFWAFLCNQSLVINQWHGMAWHATVFFHLNSI